MQWILRTLLLLVVFGSLAHADVADPATLFVQGVDSFYGRGVERDTRKGCDLFEQAAEQGLPAAQYNIGNCYHTGIGREADIDSAIGWYERAVASDDVSAMATLGTIYLLDRPRDETTARGCSLLNEASEKGNMHSPLVLGIAHHKGICDEKDDAKAIEYYRLAAERGHVLALALLFHIHSEGLYGREPNPEEAEYWRQAFTAKRNPYFTADWTIACALARAYEDGLGVEPDAQRAASYRDQCETQTTLP